MFSNLQDRLTGDRKILILFVILAIFNIALYVSIFKYMVDIKDINMTVIHDFVTINCAIIILGFTSTRLPNLKKRDSSIYEISYLIIIGLLSITISFFNKSINGESLWAPYLEMFRILSVVLILTFLATKTKSFKAVVRGDRSRKTIISQIILCSVLGILASYFTMDINGLPANARALVVMISGLLGGPYIGIPVGIISGVWRYSMGGPTALACAIATILAGITGSIIHRWNGNEFISPVKAGLLMFFYSGFEMFLLTILTPRPTGLIVASNLYGPMTFAAVLGILLFSLFLDEKKEKAETDTDDGDEDKKIELMSEELEEYKIKANQTEGELKEYKDKVEKLEQELNEIKGKI